MTGAPCLIWINVFLDGVRCLGPAGAFRMPVWGLRRACSGAGGIALQAREASAAWAHDWLPLPGSGFEHGRLEEAVENEELSAG